MHERAFKRTRLRVGTVHDGHVRIRRALLGADASDLPRYPRGLLLGVVRGIADDRVPAAQCGPQLLGLATLIVGDDRVGRVEDGLRGTVVLFEHDGLRVGEILLEILDVADVRAAERIDRLVGVADDGDPCRAGPPRRGGVRHDLPGRVHARQLADQLVLGMVRVLVFVDEDITELMTVIVGHLRLGAQQFDRPADQIVEVDGVRHGQTMLVFGVDDGIQHLDVAEIADLITALAGPVVGRVALELLLPADQ